MSKRKFDKGSNVRPIINSKDPMNRSNITNYDIPKIGPNSRKPFDPTANDMRPSTNGPAGKGFGGVSLSDIFEQFHLNRSNGSGIGDLGYMHLGDANNQIGSGNFLDYLYALLNGEVGFDMSAETKRMILEQLMQYGFTNDQRKYDQSLLQDQRAYDQDVLRDQRAYDWSLTENQRAYDRQVLQDQRLYDSPTNQLARLMGAGISRDAALQMLSGGSSGVGASAGSPVSSSGVSPSSIQSGGIPPGSGVAGGNSILDSINAAVSLTNSIVGLVNMGVSVPIAIRQANYLKGLNFLQQSQIQAYDVAGQAFDILNSSNADSSAYQSTNSTISAINNLAKSGNQQAVEFIANGGNDILRKKSPFTSPVIASMYRSERSGSDYSNMYAASLRKAEADAVLTELHYDALCTEISKMDAEITQIESNSDYLQALKVTTKALGINYSANTRLVIAQAQGQELANQDTLSLYNSSFDGQSYLDWRNNDVLNKLVSDCRLAAKTTNPDYVEQVYKQMFSTAESVAAAMSLSALKDQSGLKFASDFPEEFKLWSGLSQCGAYDYLEAQVKAGTSAHVSIGGSSVSAGLKDALDVVDPNTYKPSFIERIKSYFSNE